MEPKPVSPSPTLAEARRAMDNLKASEGYRSGELDWAGPMLWTIDAALASHESREQAVAALVHWCKPRKVTTAEDRETIERERLAALARLEATEKES